VLRTALTLSIFLGALGATSSIIHQRLPLRPDVPVVSAKLDWLTHHQATYDTLSIGSSRMFDAFWPRVFDEKMAALGRPTRSFNLAAAGMNAPETLFVLDQALAILTQPPRLVLIESGPLYHGPRPPQTDDSVRALYWHDWRRTRLVCASIIRQPGPWSERLPLLWWNVSHLARNCSNIGRGSEQLRLDGKPRRDDTESVLHDGFNHVDLTMSPADAATFIGRLAQKKPNRELPFISNPVLAAEYRTLTERMAARGTQVVFVLMPTFRSSLPEPPPALRIDLDDAQRFPALWRAEHRFDPHHLNAKGASAFSTLLAEELAPQLK